MSRTNNNGEQFCVDPHLISAATYRFELKREGNLQFRRPNSMFVTLWINRSLKTAGFRASQHRVVKLAFKSVIERYPK